MSDFASLQRKRVGGHRREPGPSRVLSINSPGSTRREQTVHLFCWSPPTPSSPTLSFFLSYSTLSLLGRTPLPCLLPLLARCPGLAPCLSLRPAGSVPRLIPPNRPCRSPSSPLPPPLLLLPQRTTPPTHPHTTRQSKATPSSALRSRNSTVRTLTGVRRRAWSCRSQTTRRTSPV